MKNLGLDIGISSIGYAVLEFDDNSFAGNILDCGVRIFTAAEQPKTGASLAEPRRIARGARRRLTRRASRLYSIRKCLIENNFITMPEIEEIFCPTGKTIDVWSLRKEALSRILSNKELYRIMMHIAKRRGFKSVRKSEEVKTAGELLKSIQENSLEFENSSEYRTIGEMFAEKFKNGEAKRNKQGQYNKSISRDLLQNEIKIIFETQRALGSKIATEEIENKYSEIAFWQRPLQSMEEMIGYCTFEPEEKRAPKCAYTSEIFTALNKLVNLHIIDDYGAERFLDADEIENIINLSKTNTKVTFTQIKKALNLAESAKFSSLNYNKKNKDGKITNPEDAAFIELKNYHSIRKAVEKTLGKNFFTSICENYELLDNIAIILTCEKSDEAIVNKMQECKIPNEIIDCVKDLSMSKVMHLSLKAMRKIIPYMLQGLKYNEACAKAGYNHCAGATGKTKSNLLPALSPEELTTNPVVNRAVSQTRKVVNALIRKYGAFDTITVEMARDLSKSFLERKQIEKAQEDFQQEKERAKDRCRENGLDPENPKSNLLKFRLWEEQGGFCIYSGQYIDPRRLAEQDYVDIDHIIPYSQSFDDSLNNKVLCLSSENRQKGNKIPYEYIQPSKWHEFVERIKSYNLKMAKYTRLTKQSYCPEGFKSRNLNDTRYIAKFIKDYIKENLDFDNNLKVEVRNGALTAFLRTQWGLVKNREENDRHHALDAIVLACSTQGMVQYLSTVTAKIENYQYINGKKPRFKKPWENFNKDVEEAISQIFVSRAIRAKVSGEIHEATIRSAKHLDEGFTTLKTPLEKINLATLEKMFDKERNKAVYNVLKARLEEFDNNPKKAFEEPVYMPMSETKIAAGQKPHQIKTIKIMDTSVSGIHVRNGFANNSAMPRVDVFVKKNKKGKNEWYIIPLYLSDFGKKLPDKIITSGKGVLQLDDSYTFCFSLYHDSLMSINKTGKPEDEFIGYFGGFDRSTCSITIEAPDNSTKLRGIGIKTLHSIKKYQVDVLGEYHEIKKEKRREFRSTPKT